jgi:hypothetical protein
MKRHLIKSCCGGKGYILELDKPVGKEMLPTFKQAGYSTAENYSKVGVFFVSRNGLTASGPFGTMKIQVRCSGAANCGQLLDHLENTLTLASLPK